jgi:hypothetical protein
MKPLLQTGYNVTDITLLYNAPHKTLQVAKTHPVIREIFCGFNSRELSKNSSSGAKTRSDLLGFSGKNPYYKTGNPVLECRNWRRLAVPCVAANLSLKFALNVVWFICRITAEG